MVRKRRKLSGKPIDAINVVPMTDILLVLLIFFLFIETVELSGAFSFNTTTKGGGDKTESKTVTVRFLTNGEISLTTPDDRKVCIKREELVNYLREIRKYAADARVVIDADKTVKYKDVISIMDDSKTAGFEDISLIDSRK